MKSYLKRIWNDDAGFLTFEWIGLSTLLTVGAISGITAIRDATIDEMGDITQGILSLDQSYTIAPPLVVSVHTWGSTSRGISTASDSSFNDEIVGFQHCDRLGVDRVGPGVDSQRPESVP